MQFPLTCSTSSALVLDDSSPDGTVLKLDGGVDPKFVLSVPDNIDTCDLYSLRPYTTKLQIISQYDTLRDLPTYCGW